MTYKPSQDPNYFVQGLDPSIKARITQLINAAIEYGFTGSAHPSDRLSIEDTLHIERMYLEQQIKGKINGNV